MRSRSGIAEPPRQVLQALSVVDSLNEQPPLKHIVQEPLQCPHSPREVRSVVSGASSVPLPMEPQPSAKSIGFQAQALSPSPAGPSVSEMSAASTQTTQTGATGTNPTATPATGSGMLSCASMRTRGSYLRTPESHRKLQNMVVRSGLKFSMRVSELLALVDVLEDAGFVTCESFKELTDEQAAKLDMPLKFAADLRIAAAKAQPDWLKRGPVPRIIEEEAEDVEASSAGTGPPFPAWGMYDAYEQRFAVANTVTGGFPQPLREHSDAETSSCVGSIGPISPREGWSIEQHVLRLQSARDRRVEDGPPSRLSTRSRSPQGAEGEVDLLQQWGATSTSHRSSAAVFSKAKGRTVFGGGPTSPRLLMELCRDLAPTVADPVSESKDMSVTSSAIADGSFSQGGDTPSVPPPPGSSDSPTSRDVSANLGSPLTMPPRWARKPAKSPGMSNKACCSPRMSLDGSMNRDLSEDWVSLDMTAWPDRSTCPRVCPPHSSSRQAAQARQQQKTIGGYHLSPRLQARRKVKSHMVPSTRPGQQESAGSATARALEGAVGYGSSIGTAVSSACHTPRTPRSPL